MNINNVKQLNIEQYIKNFRTAPEFESKCVTAGWKVTPTQQIALKAVAKKKRKTVSEITQRAVDLYMQYLPHVDALSKNHEELVPLLKKL